MNYVVNDVYHYGNESSEKDLLIFIEHLEEGLTALREGDYAGLTITEYGRKKHNINLEFLREFPFLKYLRILIGLSKKVDISPIYSLERLERITALDNFEIDFCRFPSLKHIQTRDISGSFLNPQCAKNITHALIRPSGKNLDDFLCLPSVEYMRILGGKLETLDGIEKFHHLKHLIVRANYKLENIDALMLSNSIEWLEIESVPRIKDFSFLKQNKTIKILTLW